MTAYFLDSTALIQRYVTETGSAQVRQLVDRRTDCTLFVAQVTPAELVAVLMRRSRTTTIPEQTVNAARLLIDRHMQRQYEIVRLTDRINFRASALLVKHPLRAVDALQLASALEINQRLLNAGLPSLVFVAADDRLLAAAVAEGFPVLHPNNPSGMAAADV